MNYAKAVELAKSGDEAGFNFLYEETYKSKYYLALKYMQNEEEAKDVVQDAYIRAFCKLDTLENPEKFAAWLGMIVANTAKNALQKKNPMLFSEIAGNQEEDEFEYQIEDESIQNQPEIAYSQRETQELVHEWIDSLSEEQRICILMFHIEGQSISEIAESLGCSENTVKSRLNYGRKNIKGKAEELQKKGYKLYGIAPVPFLLYLLKSEERALAAQGLFDVAGRVMAGNIADGIAHTSVSQSAGASAGTNAGMNTGASTGTNAGMNTGAGVGTNAGAQIATEAVKRGFIHTLAGKLTVAGVVCLVAVGTTAVVINSQKGDELPEQSTMEEEQFHRKEEGRKETDTKENEEVSSENEVEPQEVEVEVSDGQYSQLLQGGLTKEQFEFALAYGPESMANGEVSIDSLETLVFRVAMTGEYDNLGINSIGASQGAWKPYNLAEINNYVSALTEYQFKEEDNSRYSKVQVSGDTLTVIMAEPSTSNYVTIQKATLKGDVMKVEYQFENVRFSDDTGEEVRNTSQKIAILHKTENGGYRVTDIVDARMTAGRSEAYIFTLENLYTNRIWPDGTEMDLMGDMSENAFAIYDIDGDGEDELIIQYISTAMAGMREAIYGYDSETGALCQKLNEFPELTFYDNGFIRADASHNQSDDPEAWPYTMYQYKKETNTYEEVGSGVANDGSIDSYVRNGREVELPYMKLTEENIQSIQ